MKIPFDSIYANRQLTWQKSLAALARLSVSSRIDKQRKTLDLARLDSIRLVVSNANEPRPTPRLRILDALTDPALRSR
jgi:hypothetical protein